MSVSPIITAQQLQECLHDPGVVIVDCRFSLADVESGRSAFQQSRIPGAVYAHLDEDLSGPPVTDHGRHPLPTPERMRSVFGRLGIDSSKRVIAYDDRSSVMASRLWWMLRYMGHTDVSVLDGGWQAWLEAEGELETQPPSAPAVSHFSGEPKTDWLVTLGHVPNQPLLIDSRSPERFRGELEPKDPVAGHIPSAVNYPYARNMDSNQRMLPPDAIRDQLKSLFVGSAGEAIPAEQATFYCGSGVSACVNLLAAAHAGLPLGKLYVGSWSEWCRRDQIPPAAAESSEA